MQPLSPSQRELLGLAADTYQKQVTPELMAYLATRGFSPETVADSRFGQVSAPLRGHDYLQNRLVIPYIGPRGNIYNLRFRCMEHADCKAEGCASKYMSLPGFPTRIFNTRALVTATDTLHVTEGELDCVTLTACGLSAIGIPGVENMPAHFSRMVAGFSSVTLWADGDEAGRGLAAAFTKVVPSSTTLIMSSGQDVNSVYAESGKSGVLGLLEEQRNARNKSTWSR